MKRLVHTVLGNNRWLRRNIWLLGLFFLAVGCAAGQASPAAPKVGHTVSGSGLFLVDFDYPTGRVTGVHILKSTGNGTFDDIDFCFLFH